MANVTKFNFALDNRMLPKFDKMIDRCESKSRKQDSVLILEGKEGTGKTTYSVAIAYYVAHKTGRYFNADHVFFKIEDLIEKFQSTENQIFIWDEPALQMLSRDKTRIVADLTRLLMMARKNRHFLLINIAHFNKFNDYIIADRPIGMIKVYETKRRQIRAMYIPQKNLKRLWDDWKRRYKKNYYKYRSKSVKVHSFPDVLNPKYRNNVLDHFDIDLYEDNKSAAINLIGKKTNLKDKADELREMHIKMRDYLKKTYGIKSQEYCDVIGVDNSRLSTWKSRLIKQSA